MSNNFKRPVLALIPAREGSKGLPNKNFLNVNDKPLISFTIQAAIGCHAIDEIFVSTDDLRILNYCENYPVQCIKRPAIFSSDSSTANDVVHHFLSNLENSVKELNPIIVYLQPTSPLRTQTHIMQAIKTFKEGDKESLVSVVELEKSPFKSFTINEFGELTSLFDEKFSNLSRQFLPKTFMPNGAIYIFSLHSFVRRKGFPSNGGIPFVMSKEDSLDIDTQDDFNFLINLLGMK